MLPDIQVKQVEDYRAMYLKVRDELAELQQRTWVGLTDEEIDLVCVGLWSGGWRKKAMQDFTKAIEAKLKEKNGA